MVLLPVLHIVQVGYDQSLYHERYAMPALAMACAWLPAVLLAIHVPAKIKRIVAASSVIAFTLWLALGAMNVRATIPLWSTPLNLWEWAYSMHPDDIEVQDSLIGTYIDLGYNRRAWSLIDKVVADKVPCTNCMLNAAELAISENKLDRAAVFLDLVKDSPELYENKVKSRFYLTMRGELELLQGDALQAEKHARDAISIDDLDPGSHLLLAMALAKQGRLNEANEAESAAVSLSPPDERDERRSLYANWLKQIQATQGAK
jgi:protein O-mannosyl-transferase